MARIYPERLPESVLRDPKRAAERRVYQALNSLGEQFVVFYGVAWQARSRGSTVEDGEADFVVAHPDLGILVMEVKGGGIAYDGQTGQWSSTDRNGVTNSIHDPVDQARKSRYALFEKLRDMPGWNRGRWLTIGQTVAFPDVDIEGASLRMDLPREIVFDNPDIHDVAKAIHRGFEYYASQDGRTGELGHDRLEIVEQLLAHSFRLKTPLGIELEYEDERLVELTERQKVALDLLRSRRRASIRGCAGSGKTMLAIEKARRLAGQGFDVLLTCFNKALAEDLDQRVSGSVKVAHFHGLCTSMASEARISAEDVGSLPDALLKAIDILGPRFDAVVVDEGQDFEEDWWLPLESLLRDPEAGIFYVFFDDNQNLYRGRDRIPGIVDELPFSLMENCRNTQRIHQIVSSFYHAPESIRCEGPLGREPAMHTYRGEQHQIRMLGRLLHKLVVDEKVATKDIILLTPRSHDRSLLKTGTRVGQFALTSNCPPPANHIQVSTVHGFKGLERLVVILAEIDRFASPELDKVLYVGCSRARTHLVILADVEAPQSVKEHLQQAAQAG